MVVSHCQSQRHRRTTRSACSGRCFVRRCSRSRNGKAGRTSRSGWGMPPSHAPIPIATAKPLRAAASARPARKQTRFVAWINSWQMRGLDGMSAINVSPLQINASGADFSYALKLDAIKPLVLEGDAGYSRKSERGQASYYYSQPYFTVDGTVTIDGKPVERHRTGLDGSRMEQSAAGVGSDRMGLVLPAPWNRRKTDAVSLAANPRQASLLQAIGSDWMGDRLRSLQSPLI